jgi:hypothetical protein
MRCVCVCGLRYSPFPLEVRGCGVGLATNHVLVLLVVDVLISVDTRRCRVDDGDRLVLLGGVDRYQGEAVVLVDDEVVAALARDQEFVVGVGGEARVREVHRTFRRHLRAIAASV